MEPNRSLEHLGRFSSIERRGSLRYIVEIFKRNGAELPQIVYTFAHTASSIDLVRESVYSAMNSINWPTEVNGFRIVSGEGIRLYEWPKTT